MRPSLPDNRRARAQRWSPARLAERDIAVPPVLRAVVVVLAIGVLLVLLTWPLVADGSRLKGDSPTDALLISQQADALRQGYLPSHFMHSDLGIFYAVFAFYGGTLFAFAGAIALIVGPAMTAQAIVYVLALAAAYGGWFWLARMAGVRFWPAHAPALIYVTAPYVLTNINVRQDLAESVATAMIPLLLASALSVLRADRLRAGPVAALAMSTVLLGGSHNLTLLWTLTVLGLAALVLAAGVPQLRRMITRRGLLRVLAIVVPAMAVNAWYLFPDLAYYSHTAIAQRIDEWRTAVLTPGPAVEAKYLFALDRRSPVAGSDFTVALPVLAIAWVLIAAAVTVRKQWRSAWARVLVILALLSVAVLVVITHPRLLSRLPDPWLMIQFSYRLETFVLCFICGAVIAALALIGRGRHRWLPALLIPIIAFSIVGALRQVRDVPRYDVDVAWSIDNLLTYSTGDYADLSLTPRPPGGNPPIQVFTRPNVHRNRFEATIRAQPREIVYIDVMAIAPMIDVQGARIVARWAAQPLNNWQLRWYLALRIDDNATPGKAHIAIREARTLPIVGGWIVSLLGLLGLAASAVVIARASYRRRRGG